MKRTVSIITIVLVLIFQNPLIHAAIAEEVTPTPTESVTETPVVPTPPEFPDIPGVSITPPATPVPPSIPTYAPSTITETQNTQPSDEEKAEEAAREERRQQRREERQKEKELSSQSTNSTGGNVGDTSIKTQDATNSASIMTDGNNNLFGGSPSSVIGGASIANNENGSGSSNSGSIVTNDTSNTSQSNGAVVTNTLNQAGVTGNNKSSGNVGNTHIETGDANTTGTVITSVNTNVDGIMVSEFNVVDDQNGDIILDFGENCVSGCGGNVNVVNEGNGHESENDASIDQTAETNAFQNNDAAIENELSLLADSGNNTANRNTGGDSTIDTGDANVTANVLNFANNNIAGNVIYAVVNIYGDLVGNIIMPEEQLATCCGGNVSASNSGNGDKSINTSSTEVSDDANISQFNNVDIENNLVFDSNTGNNEVSKNTGGNNAIETGDTSIIAQTINVANMNLVGGNYWLVLVNEAGQWVGRIIGASDDANVAGSDTMQFIVNDEGEIAVVNKDNGPGSTNTSTATQDTNTTITQLNDARIVNNVNLTANTGNNSTSRNTGGDSSIKTGDATVVANIVNFVNNNIVGSGKLFVTVVNVFGSWIGDFVGPGQTQEQSAAIAQNSETNGVGGVGGNTHSQSNTDSGSGGTQITPTPTKSASNVLTFAGRVLSFSTHTDGEEEAVEEPSSDEAIASAQIAGTHIEADTKNKIHINLAWSLLGIPTILGYVVIRKRKHASM